MWTVAPLALRKTAPPSAELAPPLPALAELLSIKEGLLASLRIVKLAPLPEK